MPYVSYYLEQLNLIEVGCFFTLCALVRLLVVPHFKQAQANPNRSLKWLASAALACTLTFTLARSIPTDGVGLPWSGWPRDGFKRFIFGIFSEAEVNLNLLLFIPLSFFWSKLLNRYFLTFILSVVVSFSIECLQAIFRVGTPDLCDLCANTFGAALGLALSFCIQAKGVRHPNLITRLSSVAMIVAASILIQPIFVNRIAQTEARRIRNEFANNNLDDYHRWDKSGDLSQRVFVADGLHSDGIQSSDSGSIRVRYPYHLLGSSKCIIATWDKTGVSTKVSDGKTCREFWG